MNTCPSLARVQPGAAARRRGVVARSRLQCGRSGLLACTLATANVFACLVAAFLVLLLQLSSVLIVTQMSSLFSGNWSIIPTSYGAFCPPGGWGIFFERVSSLKLDATKKLGGYLWPA